MPISDLSISSQHSLLEWVGDGLFVEDLESKHGTFVNEHPVRRRTEVFVGDVLRFGKTRAVVGHRPARGLEDVRFWHAPNPSRDRGFQAVRDAALLRELGAQYWDLAVQARGRSTPAQAARVPEAWRGRDAW